MARPRSLRTGRTTRPCASGRRTSTSVTIAVRLQHGTSPQRRALRGINKWRRDSLPEPSTVRHHGVRFVAGNARGVRGPRPGPTLRRVAGLRPPRANPSGSAFSLELLIRPGAQSGPSLKVWSVGPSGGAPWALPHALTSGDRGGTPLYRVTVWWISGERLDIDCDHGTHIREHISIRREYEGQTGRSGRDPI